MADLDYTGFGPTSAGRAPSAAELRRASTNRYHSTRAIEAMRYIDPTTLRASEQLVGMGMGKDRSPEAVRRTMFSTAAGQGVMDLAMLARTQGVLGYGDPRQYSANITQMMSGGFRGSVRGGGMDGQAGRMIGFNQRVSGNGMLAERATIGMQRSLLDNLYGKGQDTDPRKLNGYDMTEASQVAARVVGRGGVGNMVGMIKNADFGQRMAAAAQSEVDPEILAKLQGISDVDKEKITNAEKSGDSSQLTKAIDEVAATLNDPKAEAAFRDIAKSTDAVVFNEENAKKLADTVKEVTKGMAALNDIYGDLSSDQAHALLEKVHGGRITNKQQARAATRTVDNMRNAAEYAGVDPKALFGLFERQSQNLKEQLDGQLGMDERSKTRSEGMVSKLAAKNATGATRAAKDVAEGYKSLGLKGEGYSAEDSANDSAKMQVELAEKFKGFVYSQGDMGGLDEKQQARMRELAAQFKEEKGDTDSSRRRQANLDQEMRNVVGPDFDAAILDGQGAEDMTTGMVGADDHLKSKMQRGVLVRNRALMAKMRDLGVTDEDKAAQINDVVLNKLGGVAGLAEYAEIGKIKPTEKRIEEVGKDQAEREAAEERDKHRKELAAEYGITDEERAQLDQTFMDAEGKTKEADVAKYGQTLGNVDWSNGDGSVRSRVVEAKDRLANLEKNDLRTKMSDKDGSISMRGVLTAMASGDVKDPFARADTAAATLEAMKSAGVSTQYETEEEFTDDDGKKQKRKVKRDLTDLSTTLSLDKGITAENLEQLDKVAGGKVNLVDRVNKAMGTSMTQEEFMEKSKTDRRLQEQAYIQMDVAGAEMGFMSHGSRDKLTVMNDKVQEYGSAHADKLQKAKSLTSLAPFMSVDRLASETQKTLRGEKANIGDLFSADVYDNKDLMTPDDYDTRKDKDGKKYGRVHLKSSDEFESLKNTLQSSPEAAAGIAQFEGSDKILASMEAQIKAMEEGLKDPNVTTMVDDKGQERELNQQTVNEYKAAMESLRAAIEQQGGAQKVGTMTVTKLEVTGDFNSAKK